jgi:hypothetical protein
MSHIKGYRDSDLHNKAGEHRLVTRPPETRDGLNQFVERLSQHLFEHCLLDAERALLTRR